MLAVVTASLFATCSAHADPIPNLPVFSSDPATHTLSLLMIAGPAPLSLPYGIQATSWVYQVCPRPSGTAPNVCPNGSAQPFGGVRLAMNAGDTLKVRLVNQLPVITDSKHCPEPGHADLVNNPTNLHTHGLITEPHRAVGPTDTYGDYVFLEVRNPNNNGVCSSPAATTTSSRGFSPKICSAASKAGVPGAIHPDMDVIDTAVEYSFNIPAGHPSGLYWFHPHLHGIAMNQISSGMSGLITIGSAADACATATCRAQVAAGQEQFITLKDIQVGYNGTVSDQQNAGLCNGRNNVSAAFQPPPQGNCLGYGQPIRWFHLVNGQNYPSISVGSQGSIWRILNSAPSRFYNLYLVDANTYKPIPVQVISVDGVGIVADSSGATAATMAPLASPVPCPGPSPDPKAICVNHFKMLPSSRVELRVVNPTNQPIQAVWGTTAYDTGPSGDQWPAIALASVTLDAAASNTAKTLAIGGPTILAPGKVMGQSAKVQLPGTTQLVPTSVARAALAAPANHPVVEQTLRQTGAFAISPAIATGAAAAPSCARLAPGHRRRVYFGYTGLQEAFGMGYVELDENGKEVPGTALPVTPYDPTTPTICLPLAAGDKPVSEIWDLVNLTGEDHNFHIHQTKFVVRAINGVAAKSTEAFILHDNFPVPQGSAGCDGTLETARQANSPCTTTTTTVKIYFIEVGDFVYHCHIMEHEDGGMMAKIRVVPGPAN